MITDAEKMLGKIYNEIAEGLNISETMTKNAIKTYDAVGTWLGEADYIGNVKVFPQGSFSLGTVVRSLSDEDDCYDIDLVCLLKDGNLLEEKTIKGLVGRRLKENGIYNEKLEE